MIHNSLILTPLESEFQYLTEAFARRGLRSVDETFGPMILKRYPDINLICAIGGHGKVQFGIQTQFLLHQFPNVVRVYCAGAAGGLHQIETFDVIIATHTIEHDYTERFIPNPLPSFEGCRDSIELLRRKTSEHKFSFNVHFNPVASGDEDIVCRNRAAALHGKTKALAVAWEGAGGARACKLNDKPFIEIRGITDVADDSAPSDFLTNLRTAMDNVVTVLI